MKRLKKRQKFDWRNWLDNHGFRQPDKIDILFGCVSVLCILFSLHYATVRGLEVDNAKLMTANEALMSTVEEYGPLNDLVAQVGAIEAPSIEEVNFSNMVKSEMLSYIEKLESFMECFSYFKIDTEYNTTYEAILKEYDRAVSALNSGNYKLPYTEEEFALLAYATMKEQGDSRNTDECQKLVSCVILNRQKQNGINRDLINPSIADIINEEGQYHFAIVSGYNISVDTIDMSIVTDKVKNNVREVLEGRYICPDNVVFQATFTQGSGVYKSFVNEGYGTTTYFCYE